MQLQKNEDDADFKYWLLSLYKYFEKTCLSKSNGFSQLYYNYTCRVCPKSMKMYPLPRRSYVSQNLGFQKLFPWSSSIVNNNFLALQPCNGAGRQCVVLLSPFVFGGWPAGPRPALCIQMRLIVFFAHVVLGDEQFNADLSQAIQYGARDYDKKCSR